MATDHNTTPDIPDTTPAHPLPDDWAWGSVTAGAHPFVSAADADGGTVYVQGWMLTIGNASDYALVSVHTVLVALAKYRGGHRPQAIALSSSKRGGVVVITHDPDVPSIAIVDGFDGAAASAPLDAVLAVFERAGKL